MDYSKTTEAARRYIKDILKREGSFG